MTELERRLAAAASSYEFPPTPELARAARVRLPARPGRGRLRAVVVAAAVALTVVGAVLALSPGARSAISDLLDLVPGISVERTQQLPVAWYTTAPAYGTPVSLDEAEERFSRPLRLPTGFGKPDAVYWLQYPPGDMITVVYGSERVGAQLVFSQWKTGGPDLFQKTISFQTRARSVRVGDGAGLWISGGPHVVWFHSPERADSEAHYAHQGALAGNVLAWRRGDVIYRIEGDVSLAQAVEIVGSLEER